MPPSSAYGGGPHLVNRWQTDALRGLSGLNLAPGMAPIACSRYSNYFSELELRYGIEPQTFSLPWTAESFLRDCCST